MKKFSLIILAVVAICACGKDTHTDFRSVFEQREGICFVVGSKDMLDFTKGNVQCEYNNLKCTYRAGLGVIKYDLTDFTYAEIMEEYYVVILDSTPTGKVEEKHKATVLLRSTSLSRQYDANFVTVKSSDEYLWLYDDSLKLGVVVKFTPAN